MRKSLNIFAEKMTLFLVCSESQCEECQTVLLDNFVGKIIFPHQSKQYSIPSLSKNYHIDVIIAKIFNVI